MDLPLGEREVDPAASTRGPLVQKALCSAPALDILASVGNDAVFGTVCEGSRIERMSCIFSA